MSKFKFARRKHISSGKKVNCKVFLYLGFGIHTMGNREHIGFTDRVGEELACLTINGVQCHGILIDMAYQFSEGKSKGVNMQFMRVSKNVVYDFLVIDAEKLTILAHTKLTFAKKLKFKQKYESLSRSRSVTKSKN